MGGGCAETGVPPHEEGPDNAPHALAAAGAAAGPAGAADLHLRPGKVALSGSFLRFYRS